jgi:hypothetical protein
MRRFFYYLAVIATAVCFMWLVWPSRVFFEGEFKTAGIATLVFLIVAVALYGKGGGGDSS